MSAHPLEVRMAHLEGCFEQVCDRLNGVDRRLDSLTQIMEFRFNAIDQRFTAIDQRFNWVIGTIVGTWITTILAVLFHR